MKLSSRIAALTAAALMALAVSAGASVRQVGHAERAGAARSHNGVVSFDVHTEGGFGPIARNHEVNLCAINEVEPGGRRPALISTADYRRVHGTFLCAPKLDIWGHSAGPWDPNAPGGPGWLSMGCPAGERPVKGGAGFTGSPHGHLTQVSGGYGGGDDGFWHYRFHNWTAQTVTIQFWGVCEKG